MDAHKNFAISSVATAPSPATSGISLVVASGEGADFPAVPFNATVCPPGVLRTKLNSEIVRVTAISGDTLTISRAQENSTARSIVAGDLIFAGSTEKTYSDIESALTKLLAEQTFTTVTITTATESAGTTIVTAPAFSVDGSTEVCVEFFSDVVTCLAGNVTILSLFEGTTQITRLAYLTNGSPSGRVGFPVRSIYRYTPSNASHTLKVTGAAGSTAEDVTGGSGGTGGHPPGFLRITSGG